MAREASPLYVWRSGDDGNSWAQTWVDSPDSSHGWIVDAHVQVDDAPDSPHRGALYLSYLWSDASDGAQTRVACSSDSGKHAADRERENSISR